jgi:hypothetical protein
MDKPSASEVSSYAGATASIASSLTLTEIGVIVGIATAVLTFIINLYYANRRDQREQRETNAAIAQYESHHEHNK